MKHLPIIIIALLLVNVAANAQLNLEKTVKKTERKVENRINNKIDRGIDKSLDAVEDGIDEAVKGDDQTEKSSSQNTGGKSSTKNTSKSSGQTPVSKSDGEQPGNNEENAAPQEKPEPVLQWSKYDFIPGTEIIFEDNQEGEQNGEFPSKWDLKSGSIENANFDGQNVIYFMKCNVNSGGGIVPLLKNSTSDYLPDEFTIEFDAYFEEKTSNYTIYLADHKNQLKLDAAFPAIDKWVRIQKNGAEYKQDISTKYYPGFSNAVFDKQAKWRHVSISFNTRALKVYLDDVRILNIPNLGYNPTGLTIGYHNPGSTTKGYLRNIRIAKGAVPLYDKFLTDGKFVTTGIKFDVNKATIKPESMGTINYIVKIMTEHPELKFSVEGHTDSDGDDASNLKLSEARAKAVLDQMVKLGIEKSRLTSKGLGESKPMAGNDTAEGKAQNRRVEFVKF
jgi:outer membrane protein OmpA-like peptidoglycan-associated protein